VEILKSHVAAILIVDRNYRADLCKIESWFYRRCYCALASAPPVSEYYIYTHILVCIYTRIYIYRYNHSHSSTLEGTANSHSQAPIRNSRRVLNRNSQNLNSQYPGLSSFHTVKLAAIHGQFGSNIQAIWHQADS